jgi:hypothetical protein
VFLDPKQPASSAALPAPCVRFGQVPEIFIEIRSAAPRTDP